MLEANNSNVEVVKEKQLFTGIAKLQVVAINPNEENLCKLLGVESLTNPPVYTEDITDQDTQETYKRTRVDFWLKASKDRVINYRRIATDETGVLQKDEKGEYIIEIKPFDKSNLFKISYFITNRPFISTTGKYQFINDYGQSCWVMPDENPSEVYSWFKDGNNTREAYRGEADLLNFCKTWLNIDPSSDKIRFADYNAIALGNITELNNYLNSFRENEVRVLLGVRTNIDSGNQSQDVFNRYVERASATSTTKFENKINKGEYSGTADNPIETSIPLTEYQPLPVDNKKSFGGEESSDEVLF